MIEIEVTHDRRRSTHYYNFDKTEDGIRIQIIFLEDPKKKQRTVTAIHHCAEGDPEGDRWNADMETVCTRLLPPTVSLLQFLTAAAKAIGIDVANPDDDDDDRTDAWKPEILSQIVAALVPQQ